MTAIIFFKLPLGLNGDHIAISTYMDLYTLGSGEGSGSDKLRSGAASGEEPLLTSAASSSNGEAETEPSSSGSNSPNCNVKIDGKNKGGQCKAPALCTGLSAAQQVQRVHTLTYNFPLQRYSFPQSQNRCGLGGDDSQGVAGICCYDLLSNRGKITFAPGGQGDTPGAFGGGAGSSGKSAGKGKVRGTSH